MKTPILYSLVALATCVPVSSAIAQTTTGPSGPAQLSVVIPPDLGWLEGIHIETGTIIKTRDGHVLKHAVRVFAIKETLAARPSGGETEVERDEISIRTVSVLAEPSLASVFLRKRLLTNNEAFNELAIFNFRGAGGSYQIRIKNARIKSVGTSSFEGRVVDEYVFHEFDEIIWRYETPDARKVRETFATDVSNGIAR